MNLFQIIALPIVGVLFVRSIRKFVRHEQPRALSLLAAAIWLAGGLSILIPDLTMSAAAFLGIGRGADLVLYAFVIVFIASFFYAYSRLRAIESQITELVRHLALSGAGGDSGASRIDDESRPEAHEPNQSGRPDR